jgi:tRNA nucleotidyltransferase/poly(A) polymerase
MEKRIKFDILIPSDILEIAKVFKDNGFKLFVVGGAVRDALLNQTPKDFDLATDAVPDMVEEMMAKAGFSTLPTGKAFGVINVFTDMGEYEIATFREDLSSGRRPDGVSFTNIEGDVKRRDLTINALFYDIDTNEVVDLVGGIEDLNNGVIRTVGAAEDRFGEDRLRILRAIRFAGRFGSELDPSVDAALTKDSSLDGISGERIRDEFLKGLKSAKSVVSFLEMVDKYFLFEWVFKDLSVDKRFVEIKDPMIVISKMLRHNQTDFLSKKLNNLKYSVDETRDIVFLVKFLSLSVENAVTLKKLHNISNITNEQLLLLTQNESINAELVAAFIKFNLSVSGEDVMSNLGIKAGPEVGKAIQKAETENFVTLLK